MDAFAASTARQRFDGIISAMGALLANDAGCPPEVTAIWPDVMAAYRKKLDANYEGAMELSTVQPERGQGARRTRGRVNTLDYLDMVMPGVSRAVPSPDAVQGAPVGLPAGLLPDPAGSTPLDATVPSFYRNPLALDISDAAFGLGDTIDTYNPHLLDGGVGAFPEIAGEDGSARPPYEARSTAPDIRAPLSPPPSRAAEKSDAPPTAADEVATSGAPPSPAALPERVSVRDGGGDLGAVWRVGGQPATAVGGPDIAAQRGAITGAAEEGQKKARRGVDRIVDGGFEDFLSSVRDGGGGEGDYEDFSFFADDDAGGLLSGLGSASASPVPESDADTGGKGGSTRRTKEGEYDAEYFKNMKYEDIGSSDDEDYRRSRVDTLWHPPPGTARIRAVQRHVDHITRARTTQARGKSARSATATHEGTVFEQRHRGLRMLLVGGYFEIGNKVLAFDECAIFFPVRAYKAITALK